MNRKELEQQIQKRKTLDQETKNLNIRLKQEKEKFLKAADMLPTKIIARNSDCMKQEHKQAQDDFLKAAKYQEKLIAGNNEFKELNQEQLKPLESKLEVIESHNETFEMMLLYH